MNKPKTPMPPQIQKCHDVWANTVGGQLRLLALEMEKLVKVLYDQSVIFRFAARVTTWFGLLTKRPQKR